MSEKMDNGKNDWCGIREWEKILEKQTDRDNSERDREWQAEGQTATEWGRKWRREGNTWTEGKSCTTIRGSNVMHEKTSKIPVQGNSNADKRVAGVVGNSFAPLPTSFTPAARLPPSGGWSFLACMIPVVRPVTLDRTNGHLRHMRPFLFKQHPNGR